MTTLISWNNRILLTPALQLLLQLSRLMKKRLTDTICGNSMKKILYNGQVYRVRYVRRGRAEIAAMERCCRKCAFATEDCNCVCPFDCTVYNKRDRLGRNTHYTYLQRTNPNSPWPDIAIGLVGLAIAVLLGLICSK